MVQREPHDNSRDQHLLGRQQQSGQQLDRPTRRATSNDRSFLGSSFAGQVGDREDSLEPAA